MASNNDQYSLGTNIPLDGSLINKFINMVFNEQLVNGMDKSKKMIEFKHPKELQVVWSIQTFYTFFDSDYFFSSVSA